MDDLDRLKRVYISRIENGEYDESSYSTLRDNVLYFKHEIEKSLARIVQDNFKRDVADLKVLEIGTAFGIRLRSFMDMGFTPQNLYGVDIMEPFIKTCENLSPIKMNFICCDAQNLPFENEHFDVVFQITAFSALTDGKIKRNIAKEMIRVLKSEGVIISIDSALKEKKRYNGEVYFQGVPKNEIERLFKGCKIEYYPKIYLKQTFLDIATKFRVSYFMQKITNKNDVVVKYRINNKMLNLFNQFSFCKSHSVAAVKKEEKNVF